MSVSRKVQRLSVPEYLKQKRIALSATSTSTPDLCDGGRKRPAQPDRNQLHRQA